MDGLKRPQHGEDTDKARTVPPDRPFLTGRHEPRFINEGGVADERQTERKDESLGTLAASIGVRERD